MPELKPVRLAAAQLAVRDAPPRCAKICWMTRRLWTSGAIAGNSVPCLRPRDVATATSISRPVFGGWAARAGPAGRAG